MTQPLEMDGRELFMQLAGKIARGELIVTHFVMDLLPTQDRRFDIRAGIEAWTGDRMRLDLKAGVAESEFDKQPDRPAPASVPRQIRELIFDETPRPIYDEDLNGE